MAEFLSAKFEEEKQKREDNFLPKCSNEPTGSTAGRIAKEVGVSRATVTRAVAFGKAVASAPAKVRPAILSGVVPMKTAIAAAKEGVLLFCERCTRTKMPQRNCPKCAEARSGVKTPKKSKAEPVSSSNDRSACTEAVAVLAGLSIPKADRKKYDAALSVISRVVACL